MVPTPEMIGGALHPAEAIAEWESDERHAGRSGVAPLVATVHPREGQPRFGPPQPTNSRPAARTELMFGTMGWLNIGSQEKWALEDMGVLTR